jgi:ketosteroid isomerase-like protein
MSDAQRCLGSQGVNMQAGACLIAAWLVVSSVYQPASATPATPQSVLDELLAADRAFSADSARTDVISGLSAMFADDIKMPVPGNRFAVGKAAAIEALRANAENSRSRIEWTAVRAGVSADGQHGFTFGYMTLHKPENTSVPLKYLAYWIKTPAGWRVAALKRRPRPAGAVSLEMMTPALPSRIIPPTTAATALAAAKTSLEQAERDFSDEAQTIGLGPAFAKYGRSDAVNMGGPEDVGFVVGATAIGRSVSGGEPPSPSPLSWGAESSLVASSGDLGITFGTIRQNKPQPGQSGVPFFTIWWREGPSKPWRYIAE